MNLNHINVIARYEVKLVKRSWLFRIFAILALLFISAIMLGYQTGIVNRMDNLWPRIAVSSLMPFCNTYFYNIAQSVIVVFLAGSFLKRDKKLDTAEVIYVRPMSNADYIVGKTWGIVKVFITLNIITLLFTAFLNILINKSPFDLFPYLFYLLTISVPSLLFVLGLSFTAMCILKNQAVTFIVMLGIIGTVFFYLTDTLYGVFDFFGVNIPAIFSDVTGHADLRLFLLQRFSYLLAGIGLISMTIALVKRLPHKPWKITVVYTFSSLFLLAACLGGLLYILHYNHQLDLRHQYIMTFDKYADAPHVDLLVNDISVTPQGHRLAGKSTVKVINNHAKPLDKIIFYLNPELTVTSVEMAGKNLPFRRDHQVIEVDQPIQQQEELTLTINYEGKISENICYTDVLTEDYLDTKVPQVFWRFGKRYAWLSNTFTLLTPECIWYPVTIAPVNPGAPYNVRKNFTDYTLTVHYEGDKTVLSQGKSKIDGSVITFTNTSALPGISLTIADYDKKALRVDSTDYEIYYFKGHDYFSKYFEPLSDTLPGVIREVKNSLEIEKDRDYPFGKFVLAETPVQFATYARNWKGYTEYVMPEILFVPERGISLGQDFEAERRRMNEWGRHGGPMDETEQNISLFNRFVSSLTSENSQNGWNPDNKLINKSNITPMLFGHTNYISSPEYPVIDIAVNNMMNTSSDQGFRFWGGIINDKQRANLYLESHSFETAIGDTELKPEIFYELLKLKSAALNNYITSQITQEDFNKFLKAFFTSRQFQNIPFDTLRYEIEKRFGIRLSDFIDTWYTASHTPTIYIKDVDANQIVLDEFTKYQIKFKVNNPSDIDAIISTEVMQGGGGGMRRGGGMSFETEKKNYIIPAGEAREIKIISDERPANISINTNISHNLPTSHNFNFSKIDNTISDTTSGIYPINPDVFKPNPNEIIIDNEDPGFRTIASNNRHKLKDLFKKKDDEKYKNFMPWWMPSQWTAIAADYCYGETINSAVYKNKGSGANAVEWKTEIPKDGYYEVSIWNAKMSGRMFFMDRRRGRHKEERNQTYTIQYDKEKESVTLDLDEETEGWVSIGNFYLPQGEVIITLTDKVSGDYVIADAVKFTATEE